MPATSEKQRVAAAIALSAKRGDTPKSKLRGASKEMAKDMNQGQLHDFAKKSACRAMLAGFSKQAGGFGDMARRVAPYVIPPILAGVGYGVHKLTSPSTAGAAQPPAPAVPPAPEAAAAEPEAAAATPPPPPPPAPQQSWFDRMLMGAPQSRADVEMKQTLARRAATQGQ